MDADQAASASWRRIERHIVGFTHYARLSSRSRDEICFLDDPVFSSRQARVRCCHKPLIKAVRGGGAAKKVGYRALDHGKKTNIVARGVYRQGWRRARAG